MIGDSLNRLPLVGRDARFAASQYRGRNINRADQGRRRGSRDDIAGNARLSRDECFMGG